MQEKLQKRKKHNQYTKYSLYLIFLTFVIITTNLYTQYTWTRIVGEPLLNDVSWDCMTLRDSNFLAVGEKTIRMMNNTILPQSYLVKFDRKGTILWQKTYGDSIFPNYSYSAKEDPSGNIYFTSNWNIPRLIKTDKFGNVLWSRSFASPLLEIGGLDFTDNYNSIIIVGRNEVSTLLTAGLTKVDSSGNLIWSKSYYDTYEYGVSYNGFLITESGYYIAGKRYGAPSNISFILKTDTSGIVEWQKYLNHEVTFYSICQNSISTFIATGIRTDFWGMHCVKFDSKGDTIWQKSISIDTLAAGFSIVKTLDNKFAIATSAYEQNAKIAIIDSMGNLNSIITHYFPPNYVIVYQGIDNASDSGFVLSGYVEINESGSVDFLTVKTDKSGNTIPIGIPNLSEVAKEFKLDLNVYPNPFNSQTIIEIDLTSSSFIELKLFDLIGKEISVVYVGFVDGIHKIRFSPEQYSLSSGIYFLRAEAKREFSNILFTRKISYIK